MAAEGFMGEHLVGSARTILQWGGNITALLGLVKILRGTVLWVYLVRLVQWVVPLLWMDGFDYCKVPQNVGTTPNTLFDCVQVYLSVITAQTAHRASLVQLKNDSKATYTLAPGSPWMKEVFEGEPVWWKYRIVYSHKDHEGEHLFTLRIHKRNKAKILDAYLAHVVERGEKLMQTKKQRRIYTNVKRRLGISSKKWSSIAFHHPATLETMALDPEVKKAITEDLTEFLRAEHFYKRVGRAWKRGYLFHGPPGTGKSSMIAAMANFLGYHIYDLELAAVKNNTELRALVLQIAPKSIIVIEDIDCTIPLPNRAQGETAASSQGITLSGLLNFTDGIWSCSEKIIVFTTNHIQKLDPALLRPGRMDMKIHLSYCSFPAFKLLASNYLGIYDHDLYAKVEETMEGSHMTPADVAEYLVNSTDETESLQRLIAGLERNKLQPLPRGDGHPG